MPYSRNVIPIWVHWFCDEPVAWVPSMIYTMSISPVPPKQNEKGSFILWWEKTDQFVNFTAEMSPKIGTAVSRVENRAAGQNNMDYLVRKAHSNKMPFLTAKCQGRSAGARNTGYLQNGLCCPGKQWLRRTEGLYWIKTSVRFPPRCINREKESGKWEGDFTFV